jgi:sugar lactone lactonase YvrE
VLVVGAGASTPATAASQPLTYTGIIGTPRLTAPESVAVDQDGNILVAEPTVGGTSNDDRIEKFSPTGAFLDIVAGPGSATGQMYDPSAVTVAPSGDIYTLERGVDRIQRFDHLGNFISAIGSNGSGAGQFKNPEGLVVDNAGLVYVADSQNSRIQVFDPSLLPGDPLVNAWCVVDGGVSGCTGSDVGIALSGSNVYVVGSNTIRSYDASTGTPGASWTSTGASGITADGDGNLWVTSTANVIKEYTPGGTLIATVNTGSLNAPQGLVVSGNTMYVADTGSGRILRYTISARDTTWSVPNATGIAVDAGVVYATDGTSVIATTTSGGAVTSWPSAGSNGIAVDGGGNVWVSSTSGVVTEYDTSGTVLGTLGSGTLTTPAGLSVAGGKVYVADTPANKIFRFTTGGTFETSWTSNAVVGVSVSGGSVYGMGGGTVRIYDTNGALTGSWSAGTSAGIALDGSGNVWVTSTTSPSARQFTAGGTALATVGSGQITAPKGIAATGSKVFVADQGAGQVARFSVPGFDLSWGAYDPAAGSLDTPTGLAVDAAGYTYVTNKTQNVIQKFAPDGTYVSSFGGSGITLLSNPTAIAVGPTGDIYVADTGNHRIEVFSNTGTYLDRWGSSGTAPGQFNSPGGIAIDASGNVYVSDTSNNRVEMFDPSHAVVWAKGSLGTNGGQFKSPKGLAVDASGNVWVADSLNNRVQELDSAGNFVRTFGTKGTNDGQFTTPVDVAIDTDAILYVTDRDDNRIELFTPTGTFLSKLGSTGLDTGQFSTPLGIAMDPTSTATRLLVADSVNNRIETFIDSNGPDTTLTGFPSPKTSLSTANFSFTANDIGATFECKIDGAVGWDATCNGSPAGTATYTGLTEGSHDFAVRAIDASNNPGNPTTYSWDIDLTPPNVSLTGGPAEGSTNNNTGPSFSFDADEPVLGFACSLDGAAYVACSTGDSFPVTDGAHTFTVRASDAAGNTGVSGTRHWTTDTTPPNVNITSGPSGVTTSTNASFGFTSGDPNATFTCDIDGTGFAPCTSPWDYPSPPVPGGQHTFKVIATDTLGNASAAAQRKWTVDTAKHRPDALIATTASYAGNDVYNATGSGQSKTLKTKVGATAKFKIEIQNDGNDTDPIAFSGPATANGYTISYFDGASNITSAVKAGTVTFDLSGGASKVITVKVKVGSSAGSSKSLLIQVTSGHDPSKVDAVKAVVKKA